MTGIAGCCARTASGHAAVPPTSVINSRRLMGLSPLPRVRANQGYHIRGSACCASQQNWPADDAVGQERRIGAVRNISALPPRADVGADIVERPLYATSGRTSYLPFIR